MGHATAQNARPGTRVASTVTVRAASQCPARCPGRRVCHCSPGTRPGVGRRFRAKPALSCLGPFFFAAQCARLFESRRPGCDAIGESKYDQTTDYSRDCWRVRGAWAVTARLLTPSRPRPRPRPRGGCAASRRRASPLRRGTPTRRTRPSWPPPATRYSSSPALPRPPPLLSAFLPRIDGCAEAEFSAEGEWYASSCRPAYDPQCGACAAFSAWDRCGGSTGLWPDRPRRSDRDQFRGKWRVSRTWVGGFSELRPQSYSPGTTLATGSKRPDERWNRAVKGGTVPRPGQVRTAWGLLLSMCGDY